MKVSITVSSVTRVSATRMRLTKLGPTLELS
jgi:hypothetical protein